MSPLLSVSRSTRNIRRRRRRPAVYYCKLLGVLTSASWKKCALTGQVATGAGASSGGAAEAGGAAATGGTGASGVATFQICIVLFTYFCGKLLGEAKKHTYSHQ